MSEIMDIQELDSEYQKLLYERLSRVISASCMSTKYMSRVVGVSKDIALSWINGERYPKPKYLGEIAKACNVSVDYLVGRTEEPKTISKDDVKKIFRKSGKKVKRVSRILDISEFSDEEIDIIMAFCKNLKKNRKV